MNFKKTFKYIIEGEEHELGFESGRYVNNDRLSLMIYDLTTQDYYCDLTINLSDFMLSPDMVAISNNIPRGLLDFLEYDLKLLNVFDNRPYNFSSYNIAYINFNVLNEYVEIY